MPAAMLCRTPVIKSNRETCNNTGKHKTKYACIFQAHESMRLRLEEVLHGCDEDHIAAKGMNSPSYYNFGA